MTTAAFRWGVADAASPPFAAASARAYYSHGVFVLVVGAGRVGSTVAKWALAEGHEVSVLDEDPLSHERLDNELDTSWEEAGGRFTVGTALEIDALTESGMPEADMVIVCTDGDNTNLVVAQIAPAGSVKRRKSTP